MAEAQKSQQSSNGKSEPRQPSSYIVFRAADQSGKAFDIIGTYPGRTGDDAKRAAAKGLELADGEKVVLAAVPVKSWKPSSAEVVQQAPRLVLA